MAVFRDLEIEFAGETYLVTPSMRVLRNIEDEVSIPRLAWGVSNGQPQTSHLAFVLAKLLQTADNGRGMSEELVYAEINEMDAAHLIEIWNAVLEAVSPQPKKKETPKESPQPD
jgi:hypothetical protein